MRTTYTAAEARSEFAEILNIVAYQKTPITIERHGQPIATIVPVVSDAMPTDVSALIPKYFGMWKDTPWAETVGKPSRYFRKR